MSEKIYVLLLGLYPSQFREAYGDELIQLFRDRARDEPGLFRTARLWFDLLADLVVSLPRAYRYSHPALAGTFSPQRLAAVPCFDVLEGGPPRPEALCVGGALSLVALAVFSILINYAGGNGGMRGSVPRDLVPTAMRPSAFGCANTPYSKNAGRKSDALGAAGLQPIGQGAAGAAASVSNGNTSVDAAERERVIARAVANLKQYYFDHEVAQKTADALLAHEKNGDDRVATQGAACAELLTAQMRDASHDMHLVMEYSQNPLPSGSPVQTDDGRARFREAMLQQQCMIRKAEILLHDIGYLKLDFFPDLNVCGAEVKSAMASLNHANAIIFD